MVTSFSSIIYNRWLEHVILSPGIPIGKTRLMPEMIDKYRDVYYQGKRWQWVDPLKEMNGNQAAIDARIKSRSQIIRANGDDPDEVWREIERENKMLETMGLTPEPAKAEQGKPEEKEDDDKDDDEKD